MAKRILIADDSATIQRAFAMTFGAEDVTLVAARSADEAIKLARQIQPELVIADGMMPGPSGYDLCATIKNEPDLARTAVYILASSQQPYDESRGRQVGADGHFSKPFDTTVLIERVHDALARGPTEKVQPAPPPAPAAEEDFGPPMPYDSRSGIPSGLAMPLASAYDEEEYGEISVDVAPSGDASGPAEVEYAAAPATPPPAAAAASPPSSQSSPSLSLPSGSLPSGRPGSFMPPPSLTPPPASPASLFAPLGTPAPATATPPPASMRPSLIPGIRPGAVAPGRPGAVAPARPAGLPGPAPRPPAPMSRTLMGLPAANVPIPGSSRPPSPPLSRPAPAPAASAPPRPAGAPGSGLTPSPLFPLASGGTPSPLFSPAAPAMPPVATTPRPDMVGLPPSVSAAVTAAVGAAVDEKIAAIGARGPEYAAIAHLSREIIEQIVWEVVPELAEVIIREHVERHVRA